MYDHKHYTYRITWSEEDQEHVGLCAEFPSVSFLADTPEEALRGINDTVGDIVQDMYSNGEEIPEPLSTKKYSGKFVVRVTPEQHRTVTIRAREMGISINRFVASQIAG